METLWKWNKLQHEAKAVGLFSDRTAVNPISMCENPTDATGNLSEGPSDEGPAQLHWYVHTNHLYSRPHSASAQNVVNDDS